MYKALAERNSHSALPDEVIQNTPSVYYRFYGVPDLYRSFYPTAFLQKAVDDVKRSKTAKQAWFYFNNDYDAVAIANAKTMMTMSKQKSLKQ